MGDHQLTTSLSTIVLPRLDELIARYEVLRKASKYEDMSDIGNAAASEFVTAAMAAIVDIAGAHSQYALQAQATLAKYSPSYITEAVPHFAGIVKALRSAINSGYLTSVQELIHAELFSDFLQMASYLLDEGYKDPAAVLAGGVLEEHLRKLCTRSGIPIEAPDARGIVRPRKAEALNTDLAGNGVYSKLDQKNVTAWLDLRNKAAHGQYAEYTAQQVELFVQAILDFLARNPA